MRNTEKIIRSLLLEKSFTSRRGTAEVEEIFNRKIFSFPKPVDLLKTFCKVGTNEDSVVLDFFSGSATTAHAVMQLNAEDGGKRKFIMVQLPEKVDENSEAYKAGFKTIADIGKERIRRAGEKIKEEFKDKEGIENLDIGFKVFRVADTNIRWTSEAIKTGQIRIEDNIFTDKDSLDFNTGFTDIDVVYEIMLRHRDFPLTSKIEKLSHIGKRTYIFADSVVVCLEEKITNEIVDKIAAIEPKPLKVIFRDSAFDDDISLKLNTMNRLDVQLKKHNQGKEISYRVEFI
jgi:adenine-specific DNA-methyltransferase